jgi:hypothetical protein
MRPVGVMCSICVYIYFYSYSQHSDILDPKEAVNFYFSSKDLLHATTFGAASADLAALIAEGYEGQYIDKGVILFV